MPRVRLIEQTDLPEDMRWLFDRLKGDSGRIGDLWKVLGHNAQVLRGSMILGTALLQRSKLSGKLRELAIMRTGYLTGADYEYYHHMPAARRNGVSEEEIDAVPQGGAAKVYGDDERLVMAFADGLTATPPEIPEETFARGRARFSDQELLELVMTIGYYNMLGRLMAGVKIELEPDFDPKHS